ncbi:MAG TPA: heme lyase CcmF/NrfE family subunit [Rhizomicrobium sp.]|nr:heme lyase CcmF/NrfE family subunit [Rhizomicrobium sp.]
MAAEIGQLALVLAFVLAIVQSLAPLWGAARLDPALMGLGRAAALLQLLFVALAFGCLAAGFVGEDFSIALVAEHSNAAQPIIYRFAATWGSHEGSMLLWVLILALQGGAVALFGRRLRETLQARVLAVQGIIGAAFLGFSLFTSNPFLRLFPAPLDGTELNPLLQDPGLVFHPPMLYLGYVGFSSAFSFAMAGLIEGQVDAGWARWIRPFVLASWICLTAGITMGSIWAYYTLGWGGWWFWDPVENASLMPWLMGTALLHSSIALERRGALISWTILLAILTFSLSLVGTFLVRSGVLTSVHAFAVDPRRGIYILGIIALATGSALAMFAWRAPAMKSGALFQPLSREGGIAVNNLFLLAATATVFLGTFYPVFVEIAGGHSISVGRPYYELTFVPVVVPLLLLVSFGPMLNWKRNDTREVLTRLRWPIILGILALVLGILAFGLSQVLAAGGLALGLFLIAGAIAIPLRYWKISSSLNNGTLVGDLKRFLRATPLAVWGMTSAHAGLGVTAIGITAVTAWQSSKVLEMKVGQTVELAGAQYTLTALGEANGPNYQAAQARFTVTTHSGSRVLVSERRLFPASQTTTTQAGIGTGFLGNMYVSIGEQSADGGLVVRLWDHPLVDWIWAGGFLMVLGGAASLSDRRFRVGAAKPVLRTEAIKASA